MNWDSDIQIQWDAPELFEVLGDEASREFAMAELSARSEDRNVFSSEFGRSLENYQKRLQAIGFVGKQCILDAGCGIGQWSYLMAQNNDRVFGVDQSKHRLEIAQYLNRKYERVSFKQGDLETVCFDDVKFDGIFCYGVFMFTDMIKTLENFKRYLSQDGVIFLNFNDIGHYVHRMHYHQTVTLNESLFKDYLRMVENFYKGRYKSSLMTLEVLRGLLEHLGLEIVYSGHDGQSAQLPFYKTEYLGFPYVTEVLIKHKKGH